MSKLIIPARDMQDVREASDELSQIVDRAAAFWAGSRRKIASAFAGGVPLGLNRVRRRVALTRADIERGLREGWLMVDAEGGLHPVLQGGTRDNDRNYFRHAPGAITADNVNYWGTGSRPYMAKRSHLILVTAGSDEDETVDLDWAYNSDAAPTTWTAIVAGATIDVGGSTLTAAALVLQDADAGADLDIRVPAGVSTRGTLDVAGTTPSFTVIGLLEYITL